MENLICHAFTRMDGPVPFSDAICLTQEQWDTLLANELLALQEARFQNWMTSIASAEEIIEEE